MLRNKQIPCLLPRWEKRIASGGWSTFAIGQSPKSKMRNSRSMRATKKVGEARMRVDIRLPLTHFSKLITFVKKNFPLPQGARGVKVALGGVLC